MTDLRKRPKGKKGQVPPPLKPLPNMDLIRVVQAQYFDNGPKPGSGKSQHTVTLEVYLEDKVDLLRPNWKRSVNLTTPDQMREWADEKHHEAKITAEDHAMYHETCEAADNHASDPEMQFALVGRIEDRRSHAIYPGQIVMLTRHMDGPTTCYIVDSNAPGER